MAETSGPSIGQILLILFLLSYGAYAAQFLGGIGRDQAPPPVDALEGDSSAVELSARIDNALVVASETDLLASDRWRLMNFLILPPLAAVISISTCVGLWLYKRRHGSASVPRPTRWVAVTTCVLCAVLPLICTFMTLGKRTFLSRPLATLCTNKTTKPSLVRPGQSVQARVEYSPGINSIQQRHAFEAVRVSSLTYKTSTGGAGVVECRDIKGDWGISE